MIKMVATDIDGTIVKWGCDYSDGVKSCVKKLRRNCSCWGLVGCFAVPFE